MGERSPASTSSSSSASQYGWRGERGKTNHSQFFITCAEATHCDDSYVVFGEVVSGLSSFQVASLNVNDKERLHTRWRLRIGLLSREEGEGS